MNGSADVDFREQTLSRSRYQDLDLGLESILDKGHFNLLSHMVFKILLDLDLDLKEILDLLTCTRYNLGPCTCGLDIDYYRYIDLDPDLVLPRISLLLVLPWFFFVFCFVFPTTHEP